MAGTQLVQSLERALDLLEGVAAAEDGLRLGEMADRTGLKKTTAHNLARTLCARGYLVRGRVGRYRPGPMIEDLVRRGYRRGVLRRAEPEMRTLHAAFPKGVVTFSELAGLEIHCRLRIAPELPGVVRHPPTQVFAAFGSASGLCLQAFNPTYREAMLASDAFEEGGGCPWPTREAFGRALAETACGGLALLRRGTLLRLAAPAGECFVLGLSFEGMPGAAEGAAARLTEAAARIAAETEPRGPMPASKTKGASR